MKDSNEVIKVIRRLYQITNDYGKGYDIQMFQILMLGLEVFDLDIAIMSKIKDDKYVIEHSIAPEEVPLNPGDEFTFDSTFCEMTCQSDVPVVVHDITSTPAFTGHPAYQQFKLGAYIGIPIYLNDELYGTLNFSGITPKAQSFPEGTIELLKLMALWIEGELIRNQQKKELMQLNQELEHQAKYDALTNLPNRRFLFDVLRTDIEKMQMLGGQGGLLVADLDHFKIINDTLGHQTGDEVLQKVASSLFEQLDDRGFIARFGGEEFVIWLSGCEQRSSENIANQLKQAVSSIRLEQKQLSISIGLCHFHIAEWVGGEASDIADKIISQADSALYQAKESGRNRVVAIQKSYG
ncbi:sensor domain-containing diguanylate cyclase [Vibrio hannami]|uniref:sensor domain-containing diguanylate cyclase n=1 Tax=Vibrio hannami TaxID=2717094 RepID=UPI00240F8D75|nr:sensor domain-containing diguanylate cyclase [Vibrio hannami]MDG3088026.1 sensor domain-containing diguanylate cyclase [Vibrio hannami]